jgi:iron complex transport system permease protein
VLVLGLLIAVVCAVAFLVGRSGSGWAIDWPPDLIADLRWPRIVAAAAAGAGVALAGTILQRLIRNPLASPDILGITPGAALALIIGALVMGGTIRAIGPLVALSGSGAVLALPVLLGRRHGYAPGFMVLIGISLAALTDAMVQFVLAAATSAPTRSSTG